MENDLLSWWAFDIYVDLPDDNPQRDSEKVQFAIVSLDAESRQARNRNQDIRNLKNLPDPGIQLRPAGASNLYLDFSRTTWGCCGKWLCQILKIAGLSWAYYPATGAAAVPTQIWHGGGWPIVVHYGQMVPFHRVCFPIGIAGDGGLQLHPSTMKLDVTWPSHLTHQNLQLTFKHGPTKPSRSRNPPKCLCKGWIQRSEKSENIDLVDLTGGIPLGTATLKSLHHRLTKLHPKWMVIEWLLNGSWIAFAHNKWTERQLLRGASLHFPPDPLSPRPAHGVSLPGRCQNDFR